MVFRTIVLFCHLWKTDHVLKFLQQTGWKKVMGNSIPAVMLDIIHGYCTGVLSHFSVISNWFLIIHYFDHSLLLLPMRLFISHRFISKFDDEDLNSW